MNLTPDQEASLLAAGYKLEDQDGTEALDRYSNTPVGAMSAHACLNPALNRPMQEGIASAIRTGNAIDDLYAKEAKEAKEAIPQADTLPDPQA